MARYMYSQVNLGSDNDSNGSRDTSPAYKYMHKHNVVYDQRNGGTRLEKSQSEIRNQNTSELDMNTKRKVNSRIKWFTTQIDVLPGPQKEINNKIGENYKKEAKQATKEFDVKSQLKNKHLYGAFYQQENQKYFTNDKF